MLKNYFKIAWRNLWRNKLYSSINILGLTIGIAACLVVSTVVLNDLSYDKNWTKSKNIFRIIGINNNMKNQEFSTRTFSGLGPELKKEFPEVKDYCRMDIRTSRLRMGSEKDGIELSYLSAEPSVWSVLNFDILEGNPKQFVKGYSNLVISEKIKQQYFPHSNPVGKTLEDIPEFGKKKTYLITGVIKNIPANTHLYADALIINEYEKDFNELNTKEYGTFLSQYLLLQKGTNLKAFTDKINNWYANYIEGKKARYSYQFQPITDVHLYSDFEEGNKGEASIRNVYIFSGIAFLLLLIACINFINLTTARTLKRIKESGMRKILGAGKLQLAGQFLLESLLFFIISFVLGIFLYNIFIKYVEVYLGHPVALNIFLNIQLFAGASAVILLVSLFTGLYPALLLSHTRPIASLKGKIRNNIGSAFFRKGLIIGQFTISIVLMIAMIIVHYQLHFINHKDLGFDKNNLLKTDFVAWGTKGDTFKQEVLKLPGVESVSISKWAPSLGGGYMSREIDDPLTPGNKIKEWFIEGDIDLVKTFGLQLVSGRLLNPQLPTDALNTDSLMSTGFKNLENSESKQPVIITVYTANLLGVKKLDEPVKGISGVPVGIVKNFNNESLHTQVKPCIIKANVNPAYGYMLIRTKSVGQKQVIATLQNLWQKFYPEKILQFDWVDDLISKQYTAESKLQELFTFFSGLTVFLACIGLFGLAIFSAEQRAKEIGIRKVVGASVLNITTLLSRDFIKLVGIAILIASPIGWYLMGRWLQDFAYRITISWWMFAIAGLVAIFIALLTVSSQAIKAAIANPVKSLRTE